MLILCAIFGNNIEIKRWQKLLFDMTALIPVANLVTSFQLPQQAKQFRIPEQSFARKHWVTRADVMHNLTTNSELLVWKKWFDLSFQRLFDVVVNASDHLSKPSLDVINTFNTLFQ